MSETETPPASRRVKTPVIKARTRKLARAILYGDITDDTIINALRGTDERPVKRKKMKDKPD